MPPPVYSTRFLAENNVVAAVGITCPASTVWVVRSIDVVSGASLPQNWLTYIVTAASVIVGIHVATTLGASFESYHWDGHAVLNTGDSLVFESLEGTEGADILACGYSFANP